MPTPSIEEILREWLKPKMPKKLKRSQKHKYLKEYKKHANARKNTRVCFPLRCLVLCDEQGLNRGPIP